MPNSWSRTNCGSRLAVIVAVPSLILTVLFTGVAASELVAAEANSSGFNGQAISAGDVVWFSGVIQWAGSQPKVLTHVHIVAQSLTFTTSTSSWSVSVYSSVVTYSPSATAAVTVWNASAFRWDTVVPASYSGDVFAGGFAYTVPSGGLPAGTHVTWKATFETSESCLSANWKWGAAVYTSFAKNANIGVKPVDSNSLSAFKNSDHAGTPENEKTYLTAGARGGGGSNFTGSYSGTTGVRQGHC